jgi:hypothetical protein
VSRAPEGALPAFLREFRLRRARLFLERALSGPALEPWILRLDRLLLGRAGRLWQALKLFCRRALGPAGAGAA